MTIPLRQLATFNFSEGPNQISRENGKRRVVVTAEVRGRDIGSLVDEAQAKVAEQVSLPPGYWLAWGGQFENFEAARQRLMIVVPVCFALIFLLLLSAFGSRARCAAGVQRGAAGAHGRHCRACGFATCRSRSRLRSASSRCPASPSSTAWSC